MRIVVFFHQGKQWTFFPIVLQCGGMIVEKFLLVSLRGKKYPCDHKPIIFRMVQNQNTDEVCCTLTLFTTGMTQDFELFYLETVQLRGFL